MPTVSFQLLGGERFIVDLQTWVRELREDVRFVARECADRMLDEQLGHYKRLYRAHTGTLYTSTAIFPETANPQAVRYKVSNKAYVAHILERGTKTRFTRAARIVPVGSGQFRITRARGSIKGNPVFVPAAIKWRSIFVNTVKDLMRRAAPALGSGRPDVVET